MLGQLTKRSSVIHFRRTVSTIPKGRQEILDKKPDDAVITFAKRTAMGRARKGQLKDVPVDEMMHALFKASVFHSLRLLTSDVGPFLCT